MHTPARARGCTHVALGVGLKMILKKELTEIISGKRQRPSVAITHLLEGQSVAISGHQWQSRTCSRGNQWQSVAISGHQWQSRTCSRGNQWPSVAISGNHAPARGALSGNQWQSVAITHLLEGQSVAISGNQWQSVAISGNHAPAREHVCIARRSRSPHHAAGPRPLRPRLGKSPPPPPRASDAPSWAPQSGTLKHNQAHSVARRRTLRRTLIRVING